MVDIKKVISYLIPLIFLVLMAIWLFGGSFPELKEKGSGIKEYVKFGAEEELGAKPTITDTHKEAIQKLLKTMNEMKESSVRNCFANYGGLPLLGEKGTSITFSYDVAKDATKVIVKGGAEGVQIVELEEGKGELELPEIRPCVIAGKHENQEASIAENFYHAFLNPDQTKIKGNYYMPLRDFTIAFRGGDNRIETGLSTIDANDNFEDGGWLFTPDNQQICFFPSTYGSSCEGEEGGLQNDCLGDDTDEVDSIPYLYGRGKLLECSPGKSYQWIEANLLRGSPGEGVVSGRCLVGGLSCTIYGNSCSQIYINYLEQRKDQPNCILFATMEGEDCGWITVRSGTKIGHQGTNYKLDRTGDWGSDPDGGDTQDLSNQIINDDLHIVLTNPADPELTCGNNGRWNIFGLVDVASIPVVDEKFKTEALFPGEPCADNLDNDQNGLIDCDDLSCSASLQCIKLTEKGTIHSKNCFDGVDNEMIIEGIIVTEDGSNNTNNNLIDCADPICEDVEYQKKVCSEGEVIAQI